MDQFDSNIPPGAELVKTVQLGADNPQRVREAVADELARLMQCGSLDVPIPLAVTPAGLAYPLAPEDVACTVCGGPGLATGPRLRMLQCRCLDCGYYFTPAGARAAVYLCDGLRELHEPA
jgi:hypothetical protein